MASIMARGSIGNGEFNLSLYPASQPVFMELIRNRSIETLMGAGAVIRTAFCGPCFGAGDTPANNTLSIRHSTRNFPNREGSIPSNGQIASVALMDARSIASTAINGGILTPATEMDFQETQAAYRFDRQVYDRRVYQGFGKALRDEPLHFGPNIVDWPKIEPLPENLLLKVASVIRDPVTTTDELIPSGETASYRSNPLKLAEFTLSRKDPGYVARAKAFHALENRRLELLIEGGPADDLLDGLSFFRSNEKPTPAEIGRFVKETGLATVICAIRPGDGSAREQAASCQKVLGGQANIAVEYATKRYRSNLINWGMLPFTVEKERMADLAVDDFIDIPHIRQAIFNGEEKIVAFIVRDGNRTPLELKLGVLSPEDRDIILAGCLMNYYAQKK
jgi:aconitate hydratase